MIGVDSAINLCFLIDIFINFTSAFYDDEYNLIDEHKVSDTRILHTKSMLLGYRVAVPYLVVHHRHYLNRALRPHLS
jgi:hypothetical protein